MKYSGKITKEVLQRSSSSAHAYNALVDRIIELDQKIFNHAPDSSDQIDKVFRDPADNDNMACVIFKDGQPIAYCFVKIIFIEFKGKTIRAIQGAIGVLPGQHGGNLVFPTYVKICSKFFFDFRHPTYGVGFITSPNLYASTAKFAHKIYPSPKCQDPQSDEALILEKIIAHWQVKPVESGESPFFITQDVIASDRFDIAPRNEEEAFFFKYNPGFKEGHYLGFCAQFTLLSIIRCLGSLGTKRLKKLLRERLMPSKVQTD